MKRYISIKWKIFFSILIIMVLPIIVITYVSNRSTVQSLLEQTKLSDLQTIDCLQDSADTLLDSAEALGGLIASDPEVIKFLEHARILQQEEPEQYAGLDFTPFSDKYRQHAKSVYAVSLLTTNGSLVGEKQLEQSQLNWNFSQAMLKALPQNTPTWINPYLVVEAQSGDTRWVISCITPMVEQNQLIGYLVVHLERSLLDDMLKMLTNNVYIINDVTAIEPSSSAAKESYIIANKDATQQSTPYTSNFYYTSKINYNYLVNNNSIITTSNNIEVTVTTKKYARMKWLYLIVSPFDQISQSVLTHLSQLFMLCAACILFAVIAAFFISRIITRPVCALSRTISKATEGDLSVRQTRLTNDEIGNLGVAFNSLLDKTQQLMRDIAVQQKNKRNLQLQLIQAQVKPHFLYNVLEMISSFIRDEMKREALDSISHLAHFYRTSLNNGLDTISIEKEMHLTENYLTLQHLRYIEFMDFTLSIHPTVYNYQIPKLTLQPIVENAIYHGLKKKCEKGILCVVGYEQEQRVYFEIYDNGAGMDEQTLQSVLSSLDTEGIQKDFGIASVMRRLNIHFSGQARLEIESKEGEYTNFTISFPAINH